MNGQKLIKFRGNNLYGLIMAHCFVYCSFIYFQLFFPKKLDTKKSFDVSFCLYTTLFIVLYQGFLFVPFYK